MTERDKIIEIVQSVKLCSVNNKCAECKYNKEIDNYKDTDMSCYSLRIADALIENEIGDISEYKARAEILERALRIEIRKSINQYRSDMAFDTGEFNMPWSQPCFVNNESKEIEDTMQSLLQQAKREIEEEGKQ